jgi:8-oxo-dGTP pyrophosphatase MutT (NUDIX family)
VSEPAPQNPAEPTEPTALTELTEPTDPAGPTEPTRPAEPLEPAEPADPAQELVYEVDETDTVLRVVRRGELTDRALRHRSVAVLFRTADGRVLVHRRAAVKRVFPQYYDMFVAGMVPAGESYDETARREAAEEIGAVDPVLVRVGKYRFDDEAVPQWSTLYEAELTGPVVPQESEIEWFGLMTEAELAAALDELPFCTDSAALYRHVYLGVPQGSISS